MVNLASAILPIRSCLFGGSFFCGLSGCLKRVQGGDFGCLYKFSSLSGVRQGRGCMRSFYVAVWVYKGVLFGETMFYFFKSFGEESTGAGDVQADEVVAFGAVHAAGVYPKFFFFE